MSKRHGFSSSTPTFRGIALHIPAIALCAVFGGISSQPLLAATTTTTALIVSPTALAPGKPAKLVATVTDVSSNSVFPGTVTFYDGTRLLGSAQIVSHPGGSFAQGTATLNIAAFDAGANSITAVFAGTKSYLSSSSPAQTLTVSGQYKTATTLAVSGTSGHYDLTGTVEALGSALPSGSIDFLSSPTSALLGSLSVSGAELTPGFMTSSVNAGPSTPNGLEVGDFNGDGLLDMAISYDFYSFGVYLGKGDGTFGSPKFYKLKSIDDQLTNVYIGDFNNDGILDLMAIATGRNHAQTQSAGHPVLFLGNGDGTFQPAVEFGLDGDGNGCVGLSEDGAVADFDRDGNLDLVMTGNRVTAPGYGNDQFCIFRGNGDGTFKTAQTQTDPYRNNVSPAPVMVGDLNGDKIPDLVVSVRAYPDKIQQKVFIGNGDGTFQAPVLYSLGGEPADANDYAVYSPNVALGDLNGDGKLDIVVANYTTNSLFVSPGKGDGSFGPTVAYPLQGSPGQPIVIDINRDGKPDLVVVADVNYPTTSIPVLLGNGDGTFQPAVNYPADGLRTGSLTQGDFNGDGLPDLLLGYDYAFTDFSVVLLGENSLNVTLSGVDLTGPGTNSVFAQYSGDNNYTPSTSCDISPGVKPASPVITKIYVDHIASTSASVSWTSDFPTNGYVSYGTTKSLGKKTPFEQKAAAYHFVNLTGLAPSTTYYYTETSIAYFAGCDHWTTTSHVQSFTTAP